MPFYIHFSTRFEFFSFHIHNVIFQVSNLYGFTLQFQILNIVSVIFLVLTIGPSVYFFLRYSTVKNNDNVVLLALVCTTITVVINSLINTFPPLDVPSEIYLSYQRYSFLGSFSTMSIILLIIHPCLSQLVSERAITSHENKTGRITGFFSSHPQLLILTILLLFPDIFTIASYEFLQQSYDILHLSASGWTMSFEHLLSTTTSTQHFTLVLFPLIGFPLGIYRWTVVLSFLYYAIRTQEGNANNRKYLSLGLITLTPYVFMGIYSYTISILVGQPSFTLPIPIPLLIGIAFVVAKLSDKEPDTKHERKEDDIKSDKVKIPFVDWVYWKLRRIFGGLKE